MDTVASQNEVMIEIKKSKFIGILCRVDSTLEVKEKLDEIKIKYPLAKHYTYAYVMDHLVRSSDDKEPSGTAGGPILNVLLKNHLNHVLLVVVRYFGGVLLGASNLTRAYSNTALEVLSNASLIPYIEYETYILNFSYDNMKDIDYLLRDCMIEKKEFNEIVSYTVLIDKKSDILMKIGHMAQIKKAN